jgi:hypothetical protein
LLLPIETLDDKDDNENCEIILSFIIDPFFAGTFAMGGRVGKGSWAIYADYAHPSNDEKDAAAHFLRAANIHQ